MLYCLLYALLWPLLLLLRPFRTRHGGRLVIQTAKIGDYVNTTVMLDVFDDACTDVLIDRVNAPFATRDSRIARTWLINDAKRSLGRKLAFGFRLFFQGYDDVYVCMPSAFNLFLARMATARTATLRTYAHKGYTDLLSSGMRRVEHGRDDLTLDSYVRLCGIGPEAGRYAKKPYVPLRKPKETLIPDGPGFRVGIAVAAGNKIKAIPPETWAKVFGILGRESCTVYAFGLESEHPYLDALAPHANGVELVSLLGRYPLEDLPAHAARLDLFISSDTGLSYIADAYDVPVVNFAGPCHMPEQRPVGKRVLIVESNASCAPFSFIFNAPYAAKCGGLYDIDAVQEAEIAAFIAAIRTAVRGSAPLSGF